jgi:hypothetical protein
MMILKQRSRTLRISLFCRLEVPNVIACGHNPVISGAAKTIEMPSDHMR